jgi:hypothetical protein
MVARIGKPPTKAQRAKLDRRRRQVLGDDCVTNTTARSSGGDARAAAPPLPWPPVAFPAPAAVTYRLCSRNAPAGLLLDMAWTQNRDVRARPREHLILRAQFGVSRLRRSDPQSRRRRGRPPHDPGQRAA